MTRKHKKVKRKQGPKEIPLSFVDRCLYWIGFLFVIGLGIFLSVFPEEIISRVVFSDPDVVAYSAGHIALRVPFVLYVTLSLFIFLLCAYEERRVIFGHKKGKYNPPVWKKERPSDDYSIRIAFTTEGFRTARFSVGSFKGEDFESCVKEILRLKSEVSAKKIQYSYLDLLENYFEDNRHTEVEQKLIYELFGLCNDDDREVSP